MSETMTVTEIEIGTLTAMDMKALKQCDRVNIYHNVEGTGEIVCVGKTRNPGPFDEHERRYKIDCRTSLSMHHDDSYPRPEGKVNWTASTTAYTFSDEWRTIVSLLRVGDVLSLEWRGNGGNGYVMHSEYKGQGRLFHDEVRLIVRRGEKTRMVFHINDGVCTENSARMIRRVW